MRVIHSIQDIQREDWDAMVDVSFPFASYAFLKALETSNSVGQGTGWMPCYFVFEEHQQLQSACIAYLKMHSYGEYVFDWEWASAYDSLGLPYYPKLISAIPFSPANGSKFLCRGEIDRADQILSMLKDIHTWAREREISSVHHLFVHEQDQKSLAKADCIERRGVQFHWQNQGYEQFDDFLKSLKSRKRKHIVKERSFQGEDALEIQTIKGTDITKEQVDQIYQLYLNKNQEKGGYPYLTKAFFKEIFTSMPEHLLLSGGFKGQDLVAFALSIMGGDKLYGRHWGASLHHDFLHFELCYYQAIAYAIGHGFQIIEGGAQGPQKLARGYLPQMTYSFHKVFDPRFESALERAMLRERELVKREFEYFKRQSPFAQNS